MKIAGVTVQMFLLLFVQAGCERPQIVTRQMATPPRTVSDCNEVFAYAAYAPVKIDILPLTEYAAAGSPGNETGIEAYVSLSDSFGSQIKSPGIFRFEMYERVPRSAEPKGKRIILWPDFDLTSIAENDNHWQDFLRAYRFTLPVAQTNQNCILQATCICPNSRRLSAEFTLPNTK
jgi:hypothetical protein